MEALLDNPVYHALGTGDAALGHAVGDVRYFDEQVSPFAGFPEDYSKGFDDLYHLLPPGRGILYASRHWITDTGKWQVAAAIKGLQFVFEGVAPAPPSLALVPLPLENVEEMMALTALTKPGPFGPRTIEFGQHHGVFAEGKLVAMTGQRLHVANYSEISAVCTHPQHLGKGYAAALIQQQLAIICRSGQIPFLHVRDDNDRAIALYERLGFQVNGPMNFYFLKK